MCLTIRYPNTTKICWNSNDKATVYKIFCVTVEPKNIDKKPSLVLKVDSMFRRVPVRSRDIISDRKSSRLTVSERHYKEVEHGIHTFVDRPTKIDRPGLFITTELIVNKKDLVATGTWGYFGRDFPSAVFTRVTLEKDSIRDELLNLVSSNTFVRVNRIYYSFGKKLINLDD